MLPRSALGKPGDTLNDVYERLSAALDKRGYSDRAVLGVKNGGFAIVTRVERIDQNGNSVALPNRWTEGKVGLTGTFNPVAYLKYLLAGEDRQYRMLVLAVIPDDYTPSERSLDLEEARRWAASGGLFLPASIGRRRFTTHKGVLLVYHFVQKGAKPAVMLPSKWDGLTHCMRSGLLAVLTGG